MRSMRSDVVPDARPQTTCIHGTQTCTPAVSQRREARERQVYGGELTFGVLSLMFYLSLNYLCVSPMFFHESACTSLYGP